MIEALLSLPAFLGGIVFTGLTVAAGLTVYFAMHRLCARRLADDAIKELKDATGNLLRVVGWLFCLLLSLTFTEVVRELIVIETSIEGEAAAISDTHHNLGRFGQGKTRDIQMLLADYTDAVIKDDLPALQHDRLSERADELLRQLEDSLLELEPDGTNQQTLWSRIVADVDVISDYRLSRLQQAQRHPPLVLIVVFFGYLVTMVCFGVYRPRRVLVGMVSLYAVFVGVVIYMVLAMSDPFQGATPVDPAPLEYVLEMMRANIG